MLAIAVNWAELNRRIDARMDAIAEAAKDEVRAADAAGASPTARKAYGFDALLRGDVDSMRLRARQLARRQMTWMRKLAGVRVVEMSEGRQGCGSATLGDQWLGNRSIGALALGGQR